MDPGSMLAIWPHIATLALLAALGVYSWRQRSVPAARNLAVACLFAGLCVAGAAAERITGDFSTKVLWSKLQTLCQVLATTAMLCFVLEYVQPGRWLTRRNLILLSIPPLLVGVAILTNDLHHWLWAGFVFDGAVVPLHRPLWYALFAYSLGLLVVNVIALAWLFIRSPRHRWPVGLMLVAHVGSRVVHSLDLFGGPAAAGWDPLIGSFVLAYGIYGIALFGFRILDPLPAARQAAIEQMSDGMVVLDTGRRVLSLNSTAEAMLGQRSALARGRSLPELVPTLAAAAPSLAPGQSVEMDLAGSGAPRRYVLGLSSLRDARGLLVGYLLLLHDVTEQRRAQAQVLEQQRALAMLQERQEIARELHDGIGQVLGYVKMQAQAARDRLAQDQVADADANLAQLVAVAQDAHADVREYLLGARTSPAGEPGLLPALQEYLQRFGQQYGLHTELLTTPDWSEGLLAPTAAAQLLRIIQEALTNARKHARAPAVRVSLQLVGDHVAVTVEDDGVGFDPALPATAAGQHYGLGFMRDRAAEVGGSVEIRSAPGAGTQVRITVPRRKEET